MASSPSAPSVAGKDRAGTNGSEPQSSTPNSTGRSNRSTRTSPSSRRPTQNGPLGDHRRALLEHPDLFIAHYFPDRIGAGLQDFHLRLIDAATSERRSLTLYPAGHGKTTLISEILPIWALCKDPNIRIAIVAKNDDDAGSIMRSITAELLDNQSLLRDFGPFYLGNEHKYAWSVGKLSVAKRTRGGKSDTLAVFGSGAKTILGYRTDWTICDDVVTAENSATLEQRNKLRAWFNKSVATGPEHHDSRITVVGTRFEPDDLYADIIELRSPIDDQPIYKVNHEDAVVSEEHKVTLWPKQWPWDRLMEKKAELGVLDFNKRYRNIAVDESRQVFKEEYIHGGWIQNEKYPGCVDREYRMSDIEPSWPKFTGFDPAIGTKQAKNSALVTIAKGHCKEHEDCIWVCDVQNGQMTSPQQRDLIFMEMEKFNPVVTMIETNGYQAGLYQIIEEKMKNEQLPFRVEPHFTSRGNKPDPELGIGSMKPWFMNGAVHIPYADPASRDRMRPFIDELIEYPGKTTDTVMAFWFAYRASMQWSSINSPAFNRLAKGKKPYMRQSVRRTIRNPYYAMQDDDDNYDA